MTVEPSLGPRRLRNLAILSLACGVLVGMAVVGGSYLTLSPQGVVYWYVEVNVPSTANSSNPELVHFDGASFWLWWPAILPGAYSGVQGVSILVTEPSGTVDETSTGCAACGGSHTWYSSDGAVGISWTDPSEGSLTLLVRA